MKARRSRSPFVDGGVAVMRARAQTRRPSLSNRPSGAQPGRRRRQGRRGAAGSPMWAGTPRGRGFMPCTTSPAGPRRLIRRGVWARSRSSARRPSKRRRRRVHRAARRRGARRARPTMRAALRSGTNRQPANDGEVTQGSWSQIRPVTALPRECAKRSPATEFQSSPATVCPSPGPGSRRASPRGGKRRRAHGGGRRSLRARPYWTRPGAPLP